MDPQPSTPRDPGEMGASPAAASGPAGWNVPPVPNGPPRAFDRALVVRFGRIGDILVVTPMLRALHAARPRAQIDVLTTDDGLRTLAGNTNVHHVFTFRRRRVPAFINTERARLIRTLRERAYDVLFLLEGAERYRALADQLGAERLYAFVREGETPTDTRAAYTPERHAGLRFLDLLAAAGIPPAGLHYDFAVTDDARRRVGGLLATAGVDEGVTVAGVHAGHFKRRARRRRPHPKEWPVERYAAVVRWLSDQGLRVVLTGGEAERALNARILELAPHARATDVAGRTDLGTLGALIERCAVFIAPDTGPAHLAAAVGTPLVALFGPKEPYVMGPLGDEQRIIRLYPEPTGTSAGARAHYHPRMWAIGADDVVAAVERLLGGSGEGAGAAGDSAVPAPRKARGAPPIRKILDQPGQGDSSIGRTGTEPGA